MGPINVYGQRKPIFPMYIPPYVARSGISTTKILPQNNIQRYLATKKTNAEALSQFKRYLTM